MIYFLNILILSILSLISLSVLPHFRIFGVVPLIPAFFIIALAYFKKGFAPFLMAAFTGLFYDLFSSYPFGFYLILFTALAGAVRFLFQEGMRQLSFWYYFFLSFAAIALYYGAQFVFLYIAKVSFKAADLWPFVAGFFVNLVFVVIMYLFSSWYFDLERDLGNKLKRR